MYGGPSMFRRINRKDKNAVSSSSSNLPSSGETPAGEVPGIGVGSNSTDADSIFPPIESVGPEINAPTLLHDIGKERK